MNTLVSQFIREKGQHGRLMQERNGGSYSSKPEEISKGVIYVG
jgi:hypothetical protein